MTKLSPASRGSDVDGAIRSVGLRKVEPLVLLHRQVLCTLFAFWLSLNTLYVCLDVLGLRDLVQGICCSTKCYFVVLD